MRAILTSPPGVRRPDVERERHATWLELFYDLAVVVGVAQAAHLLAAKVPANTVAMFGWFFLTFWWVWGSHTSTPRVSTRTMRYTDCSRSRRCSPCS